MPVLYTTMSRVRHPQVKVNFHLQKKLLAAFVCTWCLCNQYYFITSDNMCRATITLPLFPTFDTNLCFCFNTFGSFAPYPR